MLRCAWIIAADVSSRAFTVKWVIPAIGQIPEESPIRNTKAILQHYYVVLTAFMRHVCAGRRNPFPNLAVVGRCFSTQRGKYIIMLSGTPAGNIKGSLCLSLWVVSAELFTRCQANKRIAVWSVCVCVCVLETHVL